MDANEPNTAPAAPPLLVHRTISSFWRRLAAFVIDCCVLGLIGVVLGSVLFDFLAGLGGWGRLVGFGIALVYFGVLNSARGHGGSAGKRIMDIEVVDAGGNPPGLGRSLVRYAILGTPFFLNGAAVPLNLVSTLVVGLLSAGLGGAIVYLFVFNRRTRQSVHDLAVGTYVVRCGRGGMAARSVWRGHGIIAGIWCLVVLAGAGLGRLWLARTGSFSGAMAVQQKLYHANGVYAAAVSTGRRWTWADGGRTPVTFVQSSIVLKTRPDDYEKAADGVATTVLALYPKIGQKDFLSVTVAYGYDLGIAHGRIAHTFRRSPEEWREMLGLAGEAGTI